MLSWTPLTSPKNFLLLWSAQTFSLIALQFGLLTVPLLAIVYLDASPTAVSALTTSAVMPWLVLGLRAGVYVDKLGAIKSICSVHFTRFAILTVIAVMALTEFLEYWHLLVLSFAMGCLSVIFEISRRSALPLVVETKNLLQANSKLAITDSLTRVLGPSVAGKLVVSVTLPIAILAQASLFLIAALCVLVIQLWSKSVEPDHGISMESPSSNSRLSGVKLVLNNSTLRALTLSEAFFMMGFAMFQAIVMIVYTRELDFSAGQIGLIFSAGSVGGVLSSFMAARVSTSMTRPSLLRSAAILRSGGLALSALAVLAPEMALFLFSTSRAIMSMGWAFWQVADESTIQELISPARRGKLNAAILFVVRSSEFIGGLTCTLLSIVVPSAVLLFLGCSLSLMALAPILGKGFSQSLIPSSTQSQEH